MCKLEVFSFLFFLNACVIQIVLFHLGKKKALKKKKKRFGGEALQRYFTSIHLSTLMARKLTAWFSSSTFRQTLSCPQQLQRPGL